MNRNFRAVLKMHYDITPENFEEIKHLQGNVCAICGKNQPTTRAKRLFVDHHHHTGMLRALLCHRCNSGKGAKTGEEFVEYLKTHNSDVSTMN